MSKKMLLGFSYRPVTDPSKSLALPQTCKSDHLRQPHRSRKGFEAPSISSTRPNSPRRAQNIVPCCSREAHHRSLNVFARESDSISQGAMICLVPFAKRQSHWTEDKGRSEASKNTLCRNQMPDLGAKARQQEAQASKDSTTQHGSLAKLRPSLGEQCKEQRHRQIHDSV